jgi:hypothetical protein
MVRHPSLEEDENVMREKIVGERKWAMRQCQ